MISSTVFTRILCLFQTQLALVFLRLVQLRVRQVFHLLMLCLYYMHYSSSVFRVTEAPRMAGNSQNTGSSHGRQWQALARCRFVLFLQGP